jgi:hypothetical protein
MNGVVFEVGQVLVVDIYGHGQEVQLLVREVGTSGVVANDLQCWCIEVRLHPDGMVDKPRLASPAPKSQQLWQKPGGADVRIVESNGALAVVERNYGATLCHSNVVDVARWLAARDYRCVGQPRAVADEASKDDRTPVYVDGQLVGYAHDVGSPRTAVAFTLPALSPGQRIVSFSFNESVDPGRVVPLPDEFFDLCSLGHAAPSREPDIRPMASLAFAVADIFAHPTRDDSRRYVDMAVKALRYEPFAKAVQATLISLVGDRVSVFPTANEIMATVDACHTWEHARGMIAPGKRTLSRAETRELTEISKLAAWARVPMLDACDIGEIVAETYERVRATC